ncbi:hypothetical protein A2467_03020 [Candidatus Nomurabacteria bacterium RIFOXYC2_FULL_36_8]|nr:MAG: hypothetical protein A2467_03020 [Candidatus Nomurabacteria bacterium RIFOXYC2_FULL_36_8]
MNNKFIKILGIIMVISILSMPSFSLAESEISIRESDIDVQMWPEIPEPYQDVNIKLVSYATDLNKAIIEWRVGSNIVLSGYGKINYSMKAPGPNITTNIILSITPVNSISKIIKQIVVQPSDIEVLWEAVDGYTPPFYKGKSLISKEGTIKLVAIPNSSTIKSGRGNISYKWMRDDATVEEVSGYNKDSYIFENNVLKSNETINLTASSVDGSYNANKNLDIPIYSPKVLFYKKSPTEGVQYNKVLDSNTIFTGDEMTIVAEPYFLAIKGNENLFNYTWNINGDPIKTPSKKTELTIRPTARGGYANIDVTLENVNKIFQKVSGALKLTL